MFTTLVVPLDFEDDGDRALPVAAALARQGDLTVELITVSSPGIDPGPDRFELGRRTADHGWSDDAGVVLHADDVAAAIVERTALIGDALVVIATSAKRPLVGTLAGSIPMRTLQVSDRPVLLVGPAAGPPGTGRAVLVADVDDLARGELLVAPAAAWSATFGAPVVVTAVASDDVAATDAGLGAVADAIAATGADVTTRLLEGADRVDALERVGDEVGAAAFAVTTSRYADGRMHWQSSAREIVRRVRRPVLAVPARAQGVAGG